MERRNEFSVTGVHCASCVEPIQKALRVLPGVKQVDVNVVTSSVLVTFDDLVIKPSAIQHELTRLGYGVTGAEGQHHDGHDDHSHAEHKLYAKLVVGILCTTVLVAGSMVSWFAFLVPSFVQLSLASMVQWWVGWGFYQRAWQALKHGRTTMDTLIALGTSMAYLYSVGVLIFADYLTLHQVSAHLYFEVSAAIITFVLLGNYLEMLAKNRASQAIQQLIKLQPQQAVVWREEQWTRLPVAHVLVGDRLLVQPGQQIPVDGKIISGVAVIDESMITGESVPVTKEAGAPVIGATINTMSSFEMESQKIGDATMLARIIELVKRAQASKPPIQRKVDIISSYFVPVVIVLALLSGIIWLIFGPEPVYAHALTVVVAVLIIACPCALGLATPIAVITGVGRAAASGILIKDALALEQAGAITTVIADKTGTLTQGKQEVQEFVMIEDLKFISDTFPTQNRKFESFIRSLVRAVSEQSQHPSSQALVRYFATEPSVAVGRTEAIAGMGNKSSYQGHVVLIGSQQFMDLEHVEIAPHIQKHSADLASRAMTIVFVALDRTLVAYAGLADPVRPSAAQAVAALQKNNIAVVMLTGDNQATAQAVADSLSIKTFFARVLPQDKERMVHSIKKNTHGVVAMVGDGINDAPALAAADVGIAVAEGTDVALETAHVVLMRSNLLLIPALIVLSRATIRIMWQNLGWAFGYNVVLIPVAMGVLYPWFGITLNPMLAGAAMAFSSLSVVLNALRLRSVSMNVSYKNEEL